MEGNYDYNKCPLVPPGMRVIAHEPVNKHPSWGFNGEDAWIIGPALHHYRCIKVYYPKTKAERNVKSVSFFPSIIPVPRVTTDDFLRQAALDIIHILTNPPHNGLPPYKMGDDTRGSLLKIAKTLNRADKLPEAIPPQNDHSSVPRVQQDKSSTVNNKSAPRVQQKSSSPATPLTIKNRTWLSKDDRHQQTRYQLRPRKSNKHGTNFRDFATQQLLAQHISDNMHIHHIYNAKGEKQSLDKLLNGPHGTTRWSPALSNEWGRLSQGNDAGVKSNDCIDFIYRSEIPKDKKITYASFVCDRRPLKDEEWRIRLVVGGDKLSYYEDSGSPATDLTETKLLFNIV